MDVFVDALGVWMRNLGQISKIMILGLLVLATAWIMAEGITEPDVICDGCGGVR